MLPLVEVAPKLDDTTLVAFVLLQVNVVDSPLIIELGEADKVIVGIICAATERFVVAVLCTPSALRTVMENVLVCV